MSHDGRAVANCILDLADREGIQLSNLSLQKVTFFCHAWHLVETGRPLIKHEFEAWEHGPVLQYLYRQFRDSERSPVTTRAIGLDPATGQSDVVHYMFDEDTLRRIRKVVTFYGRMRPWDLVKLSHEEGGPWDEVWNHRGRVQPGMKISNASIARFYSQANTRSGVQ